MRALERHVPGVRVVAPLCPRRASRAAQRERPVVPLGGEVEEVELVEGAAEIVRGLGGAAGTSRVAGEEGEGLEDRGVPVTRGPRGGEVEVGCADEQADEGILREHLERLHEATC